MAPKPEEPTPDINEQVRGGLKILVRNLFLVAILILLVYVGYMALWGADPRRDLKTVDATLMSYTNYVQPYLGPAAGRPSVVAVDDWLRYFDSGSREWFETNARALAAQRLEEDPETLKTLDAKGAKVEAFLNVVNRPPLSGIARIVNQRPGKAGLQQVTVVARDQKEMQIPVRQDGSLYYIAEMGGLQQQLETIAIRYGKK